LTKLQLLRLLKEEGFIVFTSWANWKLSSTRSPPLSSPLHCHSYWRKATGISHRAPEVELPLLPFACQAAWQLQQWSVLDNLLCRIEDKNQIENEATLQNHPDDKFFVSVSYVVSCLQKGERSAFGQALADARTAVCEIFPLSF
jgi:hypothetical protein